MKGLAEDRAHGHVPKYWNVHLQHSDSAGVVGVCEVINFFSIHVPTGWGAEVTEIINHRILFKENGSFLTDPLKLISPGSFPQSEFLSQGEPSHSL